MSKARDLANAGTALGAVSATELAFVDGVTSAIQTQIDAKTAKATLTTTGDIYYASAANTPARLGIGSSAQVLTVAGGIPSWAAAGGALTLSTIASGSLPASSTLSLTGLTGDYYMLQINAMTYATANSNLIMQFNSDTGAYYDSISVSTTNADQAIYFGGGTSFVIGSTTAIDRTGTENGWIIEIKNSKNNGFHTATWMGRTQNSSGNRAIMGQGYFFNATAITSIQVKIADGYSFTGGSYKLIGG